MLRLWASSMTPADWSSIDTMSIQELAKIIKDNGIVGAGGAGFPTYIKINERAETILLNCAECEPLLKLDRQLLQKEAGKILTAFSLVRDTVGAKEAIIGIKAEYEETVETLKGILPRFPGIRLHLLQSIYPMGDEVVLIYEATGKQIRPGGLPIEQGVAVFNAETMYNIYRAVYENKPVTQKLVSIVGEVNHPVTMFFPLGLSLEECVKAAGGSKVKNPVYLVGGPMMGMIRSGSTPVTKTTNAVILLDQNHTLIQKRRLNPEVGLKRAASACCQCRACTDLCPRHALGHPIEPHKFMRAAANRDFSDMNPYINTMFCSSCGLCETYSCPQGLSPRTLMAVYKGGLRKAGVKAPEVEAAPVAESREYRKAPESRLIARLGLTQYDVSAPMEASESEQSGAKLHAGRETASMASMDILLSQHIGAPAEAVVSVGDSVKAGQVIAAAAQGISVPIHASIDGEVVSVTKDSVSLLAKNV